MQSDIARNIAQIRATVPPAVKIVAVSKTKPIGSMLEALGAGQTLFGENRANEIVSKRPLLPAEAEIHMIGHIQTNKVRQLVGNVSMIQSADSEKLLRAIDAEAFRSQTVCKCLLQFHIATEETKSGFSFDEVAVMLDKGLADHLKNTVICGVMGMATYTDNLLTVRGEFRELRKYFDRLKRDYFSLENDFSEVSMGMSGDYQVAVDEGSTMVRIGSLIFGERKKGSL